MSITLKESGGMVEKRKKNVFLGQKFYRNEIVFSASLFLFLPKIPRHHLAPSLALQTRYQTQPSHAKAKTYKFLF